MRKTDTRPRVSEQAHVLSLSTVPYFSPFLIPFPRFLHIYIYYIFNLYITCCLCSHPRPSLHPSLRPSVHHSLRPSLHHSLRPSVPPCRTLSLSQVQDLLFFISESRFRDDDDDGGGGGGGGGDDDIGEGERRQTEVCPLPPARHPVSTSGPGVKWAASSPENNSS